MWNIILPDKLKVIEPILNI